jgi:hypothetical protein
MAYFRGIAILNKLCYYLIISTEIYLSARKAEELLGNKDIVTNTFVNNNDVFADIVNYAVYGGELVVKSEDLMDMDSVVKLFVENKGVAGGV